VTELRQAAARKGSLVRTFKAVAWSFFGVRKGAEYEKDVSQLNPLHVVVAGIIAAALFVTALVLLVQWVIGSGVAAS
jgi:preprotein translocase subunit Sec61beta